MSCLMRRARKHCTWPENWNKNSIELFEIQKTNYGGNTKMKGGSLHNQENL